MGRTRREKNNGWIREKEEWEEGGGREGRLEMEGGGRKGARRGVFDTLISA